VDLEGARALVTGAASGIGLEICRHLKRVGAEPILIDTDRSAGEPAAAQLGARFISCDVSDPTAWRQAAQLVVDSYGGIDVACLNAGVRCRQQSITALDATELARVTGVNINGVVFGIHHAAKLMAPRGGSIVVTASIAGLRPTDADPIYSMTKHAVIGLMRSLVSQLQAGGIAINAVCPSVTDTPMVRDNVDFFEGMHARQVPLLQPADIAEATLSILRSGGTGQAVICGVGHVPYPWTFPAPDLSVAEWYRP
jgi:NAD(P)-dependent dehydrogenase (short-subunit alcohol dehydrogenase family)